MNFFLNQGMGHGNSGVEHAQFYRAQCFDENQQDYKLVFVNYLPELHLHMQEWQLAEKNVIGLYDFLLANDPGLYLDQGISTDQIHKMTTNTLIDQTQTHRFAVGQTTGDYQYRLLKNKVYNEQKKLFIVDDAQVELTNGSHRVTWSYRPGPGEKIMQDIYVENFLGQNYYFQTYEELIEFFIDQLDQHFGQNIYYIDRGTFFDETLVKLKERGGQQKVVGMVHANHFVERHGQQILFNNFYQYMLDHLDDYDAVVVATHAQKEGLAKDLAGYTKPENLDKIVAIPVGGVEKFGPVKEHEGKTMNIVTASRLHPEKHLDQIIDAVALLAEQKHSIRLTIYGAGAEKDPLKEQIKKLGMKKHIHLAGLSQNVAADIASDDVFVSASYSEGFGLTYLEALSRGLPVASYANDFGAKELIHSGENGWLADFGRDDASRQQNVENLAQAILDCFNNYEELSAGALATAKKYQIETIRQDWLNLERKLTCKLD
ncbi:glycosyltransferase [Fructobacillus ficulneus]|nr:glycosyltransferase [Fructobacillus ficulneus]